MILTIGDCTFVLQYKKNKKNTTIISTKSKLHFHFKTFMAKSVTLVLYNFVVWYCFDEYMEKLRNKKWEKNKHLVYNK